SLVAATFLFFIPLALLAMTGPFLIRTLIHHVDGVGGSVGRLSAISTLGSVAGTVLIGYVLIPFLPNSITMFLTSGLLAAVSSIYLLLWNTDKIARVTATLCLVIGAGVGYAGVRQDLRPGFTDFNLLFRGNSNFGRLEVIQSDDGGKRYYLNDYLVQNTYDPATKQSLSLFSYMLHGLAQGYTPKVNDALCIGMGIGIVPMDLARDGARVDVVEINPAVVPVAQQFFGCETNRFQLTIGDGRQFLNETKRKYDTVVLDAFLGDSSPSHLMTRETFTSMRNVLHPDGTLVINCFGGFDRGRDFFVASLDKTLRSVFASVRIHATGNGNVFFVASARSDLKILHPYDLNRAHSTVKTQVEAAFSSLREASPTSGRVLTDDFNPVEFYDAVNRERFRRDLAEMARTM
ncbi:MAG: fused MFS/spermidine synthase, partial [Opitutaceae bacterium]|nr:fused MFS/spermidine synthase [Verrucomicrobiales bacterium]